MSSTKGPFLSPVQRDIHEAPGTSFLILHDHMPPDSQPDHQDVLIEANNIGHALNNAGYRTERYELTSDFAAFRNEIKKRRPAAVINLVETVDGSVALAHVPLLVLDCLGVPYTGAGADAVYLTSNKVLAKKLMQSYGIPTPGWWDHESVIHTNKEMGVNCVILKRIWEDASVDITDERVRAGTREDILTGFGSVRANHGDYFVEEFIEGREINVCLIEDTEGVVNVLPPTEILFESFPPGKPEIVNYAAKWTPDSFEYTHTPRTFFFPESDRHILEKVIGHARACWNLFGVRGYARVDFRIDSSGNPWALEVNVNPCISPDGGFFAAFQKAGLGGYDELASMLLCTALNRNRKSIL